MGTPGTLGEVLYGNGSKAVASEREWVVLVRSIAAGDQPALHALYERAHRPVYTLMVRLTANRETAEELTVDVFHDVWRRAGGYDPNGGTVLAWIMNQARSRAIDRLRFDQRKKRAPEAGVVAVAEDAAASGEAEAPDAHDVLAFKQEQQALRGALARLNEGERAAIEAAFFSGLSHAEVAARLNELGTIKSRIRSGLHKLRQGLSGGEGT